MRLKILCLIFILSCNTRQNNKKHNNDSVIEKTKKNLIVLDTSYFDTEVIEIFVDSLNIGEKGKNKIELIRHRVFDDSYVIVNFYNLASISNYWYIQNTYIYKCNAIKDLEPQIADFNNDNFNDITFISTQAARSSNEVRRLFVYNNLIGELASIVNSEDYPNMLYNRELNCIDAFLIHGGSSTVFTKIKGDSLIEIASVHNDSHRTVYEIDEYGKEKLLSKDKISSEDIYIRYINYKPLKEYKD